MDFCLVLHNYRETGGTTTIVHGYGTCKMYHGQPWFILNVPWPAMVYEIHVCTVFHDLRWFHGTFTYTYAL